MSPSEVAAARELKYRLFGEVKRFEKDSERDLDAGMGERETGERCERLGERECSRCEKREGSEDLRLRIRDIFR